MVGKDDEAARLDMSLRILPPTPPFPSALNTPILSPAIAHLTAALLPPA